MALSALRTDERFGLGIAVVLHVALVAALIFQPEDDSVPPMPERMTVSLATDVSLADTAPDPVAESRAAIAPTISDDPQAAPPMEKPAEAIPAPQPVATAAPPAARPVERMRPDRQQPAKAAPPKAAPKPAPAKASAKPAAAKAAGGSRIGADFLPGAADSTATKETRVPASQIGASAKASLGQAIARQLKPHWNAPQGVDAEQLVTILAFNLNEDGSLAGRPRVVSQSGVTDSNSPQKELHAERAIRAVQLAAPFDLPPEYYEAWKRVTSFRFDRKL